MLLNRFVAPQALGPGTEPFSVTALLDALTTHLLPIVDGSEQDPALADLYELEDGRGAWIDYSVAACISAGDKASIITTIAQVHDGLGLTLFDVDRRELVAPCRPKSFVLTLEDTPPVFEPALDQAIDAIRALRCDRSPSYAVLEHASGNYFQLAADATGLAVEMRAYSRYPDVYRHVAAVDPGSDRVSVDQAIVRLRAFWNAPERLGPGEWEDLTP